MFRYFKITFILLFVTATFFNICAEDTGDYIHYRLGVKYKNEKKYDQAIEEFRKVLASYPDNYNSYMYLAEIRADQEQYQLVIYNLKKALDYNPGWGKAHKMLADAYEKDGQLQKAIMELQQYLPSSDPGERDSLQGQIDRLILTISGGHANKSSSHIKSDSAFDSTRVKSHKKVEQIKNKPLATQKDSSEKKIKPLNSNFREEFSKAVELYNQKKYTESLKSFRKLLSVQPGYPGIYYYAGLIRRRNGQNDQAKTNFLKAIDYPEMGHNAHFYLGKIYSEEKNYKEAIRHLNAYIQKTSFDAGKNEALALIAKYQDALKGKQTTVKDTLEDLPEVNQEPVIAQEKYPPLEIRIDSLLTMMTVDTLTTEGQRLLEGIRKFRNGEYDKSIEEFKKVLIAYPSGKASIYCIYNTGVCYFKLRLFKNAENQFQQVIDRFSLHPLAAQSLFLKGLSYLERDESATAETIFRNFIQNNSNHRWVGKAYEKLGDTYIDLEQPKKAIDAFVKAVSLSGDYSDKVCTLFKLGTTYFALGNSARGIESFNQAIEIGEKHDIYIRVPDSYYRIADEKYKQKDYKGALGLYTKVTRKYPAYQETPWGLFQIGSIDKNLKQFQDAINTFRELMRKYPDDYWAKQAQWKMEDAVWENEYQGIMK